MSEYKCWITDFPKRCGDLLTRFESRARMGNREVTLLLAVASACIAIPYDRMKERRDKEPSHPLADRDADDQRRRSFDELLEKRIGSLGFWPGGQKAFRYGELKSVEGYPDQWPELTTNEGMNRKKQFGTLIDHLRNALAHGNIHTRGRQIDQIVLLSRKYYSREDDQPTRYMYLVLTPQELRDIVMVWIDELDRLQLPLDDVGAFAERWSEASVAVT